VMGKHSGRASMAHALLQKEHPAGETDIRFPKTPNYICHENR
jgi:hypothetical protein